MSAKIRERVSQPDEIAKDSVVYMIQVESRHGWYEVKQNVVAPMTFKTEADAERYAQNPHATPVPPGRKYRIIKSRMVWEVC